MGAAARAAVKRNAVAFTNLSLALNSEQLVILLVVGQTTDWPSGLVWKVIEALYRRFKPNDIVSKIKLCQMLIKFQCKNMKIQ